jgi:hypothetical protein
MKHKFLLLAFVLASIGFAGCSAEQYSQTGKGHLMKVDTLRMMKVDDIVALSKAGVSDSLIIGMMDATDTWFRLKAQDVIDLRNAGVSEKVIVAMMQPPPPPASKTGDGNMARYYYYPSYFWYDGFYYPYWYYPRVSIGFGYRSYFGGHFHSGRHH